VEAFTPQLKTLNQQLTIANSILNLNIDMEISRTGALRFQAAGSRLGWRQRKAVRLMGGGSF
jgi:hypothetical protein